MWKVTLDNGSGTSLIFWVDGSSAPEAETTARRQAGDKITDDARAVIAHADDLDPAKEVWPRPRLVGGLRVFTFDDSRAAYDHSQVHDDLHDGYLLHIPAERVSGQAWPVAVSAERGSLHGLVDPNDLAIDGRDYRPTAGVAKSLLDVDDSYGQAAPPRLPSI